MNSKENLSETIDRHIEMRKNIDKSLEFLQSLNPIDSILKQIEGHEEFRDQQAKVESLMNRWISIFENMLEQGQSLPVDLIARASQIAKEMREEHESESPGSFES